MLLDYGDAWLMGNRGEAATSIPGTGGAATLPVLFISASRSAKQDVKVV